MEGIEATPGSRMVRVAGGLFLWCLGSDSVKHDVYRIDSDRFYADVGDACAQGTQSSEEGLNLVGSSAAAADGDDLTVFVEENEKHFPEVDVGVDANLHSFSEDSVSEYNALLIAVVELGEDNLGEDGFGEGDGALGGGLLLCHNVLSLFYWGVYKLSG